MKIQLLFFGIARDLVGEDRVSFKLTKSVSVKELKELIINQLPTLKNIHQFAIAVNEDYADDNLMVKENDLVAIIPPVSGG